MDFKNIALFAAIGSIAAFFNQVKNVIKNIFTFFVRTSSVENLNLYIIDHLFNSSKIIKYGNTMLATDFRSTSRCPSGQQVFYEKKNTYFILFKKYIPLLIKLDYDDLKITYLMGTFNFEKEFNHIYEAYTNAAITNQPEKTGHFLLEISGKNKVDFKSDSKSDSSTISHGSSVNPSNGLYFKPHELKSYTNWHGINADEFITSVDYRKTYYWTTDGNTLLQEVEFWLTSKEWFLDRMLPWKRSALLKGSPGTGKSKLVLEIAKKLQLPLVKLNISGMDDEEFVSAFDNAGGYSGKIILIEDIDSVFVGRENILAKNNRAKSLVSFDTLINTIAGVKERSGMFVIITTNHVDKLDPALLRAGRMDIHVELPFLDNHGKTFIANNILSDWPAVIHEVCNDEKEVSAADFENICKTRATTLFWESKSERVKNNSQSN